MEKVAAALVAGNAVVAKPPLDDPLVVGRFHDALIQAGRAAEVLALVHGGRDVGRGPRGRSAGGRGVADRLDRRRHQRGRGLGAALAPAPPGARRQQRLPGARRRRPGARHVGAGRRPPDDERAGLLGLQAHPGRPLAPRRPGGAAGGRRRGADRRSRRGPPHHDRPPDHRRGRAAGALPDRRGRRPGSHGRRRRGGARGRAARSDGAGGGAARRRGGRGRRDQRAGVHRDPGRRRRRGPRGGQRVELRPDGVGVQRRPRARDGPGRAPAGRWCRDQRDRRLPAARRPVRRREVVGHRKAGCGLHPPRAHAREDDRVAALPSRSRRRWVADPRRTARGGITGPEESRGSAIGEGIADPPPTRLHPRA